jgi:hypothetical protein
MTFNVDWFLALLKTILPQIGKSLSAFSFSKKPETYFLVLVPL